MIEKKTGGHSTTDESSTSSDSVITTESRDSSTSSSNMNNLKATDTANTHDEEPQPVAVLLKGGTRINLRLILGIGILLLAYLMFILCLLVFCYHM
jgi:hypothetical protein